MDPMDPSGVEDLRWGGFLVDSWLSCDFNGCYSMGTWGAPTHVGQLYIYIILYIHIYIYIYIYILGTWVILSLYLAILGPLYLGWEQPFPKMNRSNVLLGFGLVIVMVH